MASVADSLRATIPALVALVNGSSPEAFQRKPSGGGWSASTLMGHLADAEMVYGVRIRTALAEPGSTLPAFDEETWADRFGPLDDDPQRAFGRFRVLRESNVAIVESLTEGEWQRVGLHEEFGELSVRELVDRLLRHDAAHLDQIRTALGSS